MVSVFKILMIVFATLSFFVGMSEKETAKQKAQVAIFVSAGILFLLAEALRCAGAA